MICSFPLGILCYNQALSADSEPFNYSDRLMNFMTYYIVINVYIFKIYYEGYSKPNILVKLYLSTNKVLI